MVQAIDASHRITHRGPNVGDWRILSAQPGKAVLETTDHSGENFAEGWLSGGPRLPRAQNVCLEQRRARLRQDIVSVQVELTDSVVVALKKDIGRAVQRSGGRGLFIGVSGMFTRDSCVSCAVQKLAQMARLRGVEAVKVGLRPAAATTRVDPSVRRTGVKTALNLERGLELSLRGPVQKEPEIDRR
ncbi:hypothetical protein ACFL5O_06655 [Myxococcota bacterium]